MSTNSGGRGPRKGVDSLVEVNEVRDVRRRIGEVLAQLKVWAHSKLTGLLADDHTQYALLAGRGGGQTLKGGTAASENLTLQSTSNATRGVVQTNDPLRAYNAVDANVEMLIAEVSGGFSNGAQVSMRRFGINMGYLLGDYFSGLSFGVTNGSGGAATEKMRLDVAGHLGIGGAPAASGALDVQSTTGALIVPRMTTAQKNALTATDGMIVYDTTLAAFYKRQAGAWVAF